MEGRRYGVVGSCLGEGGGGEGGGVVWLARSGRCGSGVGGGSVVEVLWCVGWGGCGGGGSGGGGGGGGRGGGGGGVWGGGGGGEGTCLICAPSLFEGSISLSVRLGNDGPRRTGEQREEGWCRESV